MKSKARYKKIFLFNLIFLLLLGCTSCSKPPENTYITWINSDGTLIDYITATSDYDPSQKALPPDTNQWKYTEWLIEKTGNRIECIAVRVQKVMVQWLDSDDHVLKEDYVPISELEICTLPLPEDSNEWHYTEWKKSATSAGYVYKAQRVHKTKHIWKDADGTIIKEDYIIDGQEIPSIDLPTGNQKWVYTGWDTQNTETETVYTALRTPNSTYFCGNVFQIVLKDPSGAPLGTGSGFIINEEGWFITNDHVMDGASSAVAFFDIRDSENGRKYTELNIYGGAYHSSEKDIFIGKIEGYHKIKEHYQAISFSETYVAGERAHTIGYPNSSVKMEINSGVLLEDYSDIYSKINGIYYILSDSYIAPGSSGGILINDDFEVLGITTIGFYADDSKKIYRAGGSVPFFVFSSIIENLDELNIKPLAELYNQ